MTEEVDKSARAALARLRSWRKKPAAPSKKQTIHVQPQEGEPYVISFEGDEYDMIEAVLRADEERKARTIKRKHRKERLQ